MGLFDGAEDPLSEVSDALGDFGGDDEADALDEATRWIQGRIDAAGTIPTLRARFLIGAPKPGTVPIDQVDWADAIVQAGRIGDSLFQRAGLGNYGGLGAAVLEKELDDRVGGIEDDPEQPMHWVESIAVDEGLSTVWTATIVVAKPDALGLIVAQPGAAARLSVIDSIGTAFSDQDKGLGGEIADVMALVGLGMTAVNNPDALANQIWDTKNPDLLDTDPTRVTGSHATQPTTEPFVGKTVPESYLGAFARLSLARRFNDDHFTLNERWFSGRVMAFEDLGYDPTPARRARRVRLTIRPHLAQLGLRRRYRAFKNLNAVQIVRHLLLEHGIYQQESTKDATGTAIRFVPGGRELFGPLGVPDAASAAIGKLSGLDPFGVSEKVTGAINDVLEQPIEDWRPKREYCVQYGETDLELMERLLAEEGLTFFFEHRERLQTLVICEDPRLAGKKVLTAGRLPLLASTDASSQNNPVNVVSERAWNVAVARRPVPSGVTLRDRNHARPYDPTDLKAGESLELLSPGNLSSLTTLGGLEQMANQAMGLAGELSGAQGTEDYAGPDAQWFEWSARLPYPREEDTEPFAHAMFDGPPMAQLRLEQFRSRGAIARGTSDCATLSPGASANIQHAAFDVLHPAVQKPQRFLITRVRHIAGVAPPPPPGAPPPAPGDVRGSGAGPAQEYDMAYSNSFEALNIVLPYRPVAPMVPRPRIRGVHTAFVIDRQRGEEPNTNPEQVSVEPLRSCWEVRVRMPWERPGETVLCDDADSVSVASTAQEGSRWMRFAAPFTGAGFGWLAVPRVGMEVVIGYEEGDPDRPYVLAAVYSDAHDRTTGARHASSENPRDVAAGRIDFPARMNDAGFTSRSWPQAGEEVRGNRVRFDDTAGDAERGHGRIEVFAQHDYAKEVGGLKDEEKLGDHVTTVRGDQLNEVLTDQRELVHGDQVLLARHPSEGTTDWGREVRVKGDEKVAVGGGERAEPSDDEEDEEEKPATDVMLDEVVLDDSLVVNLSREIHVAGDETIQIEGEGATEELPGRLLDVAQGNSKVEIDGGDTFVVTGDRRVKAKGAYTILANKIDIKTVTQAAGDGPGQGEENGGLSIGPDGASLTTKGAASIETGAFTAESRQDRVLVKAKTKITLHDGTGQGNSLVLDAESKTIVLRVATATDLTLGTDVASLKMTDDSIELAAASSSWRMDIQPIGTVSKMVGDDVSFEATDEIWLHAPSIYLGDAE